MGGEGRARMAVGERSQEQKREGCGGLLSDKNQTAALQVLARLGSPTAPRL